MGALSDDEFRSVLNFVRTRVRVLGQNRPRLNGVTCFCATSVRVQRALDTLQLCAELCEFDEIVLATHETIPARRAAFLRVAPVRPIQGKGSYSYLILDELKKIVRTEYVLVVQDDGFILNPGKWDNAFYGCDYVGAPWPPMLKLDPPGHILRLSNRVGNGGFSFRSRRLLEECSSDTLFGPEDIVVPEDVLIGHFNHAQLCAKGIRFADLSLASRFSGETPSEDGALKLDNVFGFHGDLVLEALAVEARRRVRN